MSLSISCSPKLRGTSTWLTLPQPDPRMMVHSAVTWRLNQNLKRSRINCISSGLPLKRPNVSSTEPWVSTNMDSNQKPVASLTSGLLLRSKIPGNSIRLRTFLPAITSHRHYQYAGNCTRTHHWWWSHQHLLLWSKLKTPRSQNTHTDWKLLLHVLLILPPSLQRLWKWCITSCRKW